MTSTHTFAVDIIIRRNKNDKEKALIYARITMDGETKEISLKESITVSEWDSKSETVTGKSIRVKSINNAISETRDGIKHKYSISEPAKLPSLLLKLSDLLRYVVYDTGQVFVPLSDELAYLDNYIEFEKIRVGDKLVLKTLWQNRNAYPHKIAPMLLIVFMENAFKHSRHTVAEKIYIDASLQTTEDTIRFSVKNTKGNIEKHGILSGNSGFGLAGVRKRLQLLYPDRHQLQIEEDKETYCVNLQLQVK